MTTSSIEVEDLRFAYGDGGFCLRLPSMTIAAGERVACAGPSGCGKSTLVQLIAGILTPDEGVVRAGSELISAASDAQRRSWRVREVGLVFQDLELLEHLTAGENILLPRLLMPGGRITRADRERAADLAASMGVAAHLNRRPARLSRGERQRVAICRALFTRPSLLICDEPTGSLDPESTVQVVDLLTGLVDAEGCTLIMVTHDHSVLDRFDRVLHLNELNEASR